MNVQLKFEPRAFLIGFHWNFNRSIESQYRRLDLYICPVPMLHIHIEIAWGWKNRDKAYETYCQQCWDQGVLPMGYRQWKKKHKETA